MLLTINPKEEFLEMAENALRGIGWNLPDYIIVVGQTTTYSHSRGLLHVEVREAKYKIKGVVIPECHLEYYNHSTHIVTTRYYYDTKKVNKSVFEFFDNLSPMLFLLHGLKYNLIISKDSDGQYYIEIRRVNYW